MAMGNWVCLKWRGERKKKRKSHSYCKTHQPNNNFPVYVKASAGSGEFLVEVSGESTFIHEVFSLDLV